MVVGLLRVTFFLPATHSLKEKRMLVRRIKDRVQAKFNAAIAEVDAQDLWQKGVLGVAVVAGDRAFAAQMLDQIARLCRSEAEVTNVERELASYHEPLRENDLGFRT